MNIREAQLEVLKIMGARIDQEHSLIGSRMTWLMTLNGFLFAALGLVVANSGNLTSGRAAAFLVLVVATLGTLSNASALYSHYWASRAIHETELATRWALSPAQIAASSMHPPEALFRLFGRDPKLRSVGGHRLICSAYHPMWPLQKLVHPWFFLPLLCCGIFAILPLAMSTLSLRDGKVYDTALLVRTIPLTLLCLMTFGVVLGLTTTERRSRTERRNRLADD